MDSEMGPVAIYTVTLSDGTRIPHKYNVPRDLPAAHAWLDSMTQLLMPPLLGKTRTLFLQNPSTAYNVDHVAAVSWEFIDAEDFEELFNKVNKDYLDNTVGMSRT